MEVSGQLHVPAALPPEKKPLVTHWTGGWVDNKLLPLSAGCTELAISCYHFYGKYLPQWSQFISQSVHQVHYKAHTLYSRVRKLVVTFDVNTLKLNPYIR
jgi:hypothetical protein